MANSTNSSPTRPISEFFQLSMKMTQFESQYVLTSTMALWCHNFVFDASSRYFTPNKLQRIAYAGKLMNLKKISDYFFIIIFLITKFYRFGKM